MSKACGITGPLHTFVRGDTKTAGGKKSDHEDVFPNNESEVYYPVNRGTKAKPQMEDVKHNVRELVRQFVKADAIMKSAKDDLEEAAQGLRVFGSVFREKRFKNTERYQRSYRINGPMSQKLQYAVSCAAQNRFSMPKKDEDIDTLRKVVGKDFFKKNFTRELTVSIRKEVIEDKKKRKELTALLIKVLGGTDEFKKWFVKEEVWAIKADAELDKYRLSLDDETREQFDEICKQYADQIKNASYDASKA